MADIKLDDLTLYHFTSCPFCIKVRVVLKLMGVTLQQRNIHANPQFKTELIHGGGKKQVPCLRIQDGDSVRWLYESSDIIGFVKQHF